MTMKPPYLSPILDTSGVQPHTPDGPYADLVVWKALQPHQVAHLKGCDAQTLERWRLVDGLLCMRPALADHLDDLLTLPIESLRHQWTNAEPKVRRRTVRIERYAKSRRQPVRYADLGLLAVDWCLKDNRLHHVERWRSWVDDREMETSVVVPVHSLWVDWCGKRVRAEQLLYALQNPAYALPTGTRRRPYMTKRRRAEMAAEVGDDLPAFLA